MLFNPRSQPPLTSGSRKSGFKFHLLMVRLGLAFCVLGSIFTVDVVVQAQEKPREAPPRLLANLRSKDRGERRQAATELGVMRARGAVRGLAEALSDKEETVREAA